MEVPATKTNASQKFNGKAQEKFTPHFFNSSMWVLWFGGQFFHVMVQILSILFLPSFGTQDPLTPAIRQGKSSRTWYTLFLIMSAQEVANITCAHIPLARTVIWHLPDGRKAGICSHCANNPPCPLSCCTFSTSWTPIHPSNTTSAVKPSLLSQAE